MPYGSPDVFIKVQQCIWATKPDIILDLGIGYGMNGAGIRNWYSRTCELIGVEIFRNYDNPMWRLYDKVLWIDIEELLQNELSVEFKYDMVLMTDVIEHFPKEKGREILHLIAQVTRKAAVVTTPAVWFEQGDVGGNEYERHHAVWTPEDFQKEGWGIVECHKSMIIADYIVK
jgi:hypothetical protein